MTVTSVLFFIVTTFLPIISIILGFAMVCSVLYAISVISMFHVILLVVAFIVVLCSAVTGLYYHAIEWEHRELEGK